MHGVGGGPRLRSAAQLKMPPPWVADPADPVTNRFMMLVKTLFEFTVPAELESIRAIKAFMNCFLVHHGSADPVGCPAVLSAVE
ncbi:hypothetical protein A5780_36615 [Nocardia sp. 852002-20019_SCH5090214]|uniref:Uncharacterized protein n=1 Tax=Nocardia nova TaxID=37330 RepID=A0A2S5ZXH3_9NOCA|nr:hypothetical protein A5789_15870 [Nocardia sp. 852002-51101_SCH5132738]OBA44486.1 hypothetical protein A5780_36615 [Nocardia sp. 852002-20019_SCH5090214]OBB35130.1 hypothetical protein A5748_05815 [Nocardia sp. 852002-51244_SCH5132740]OBF66288.1 hypothetical protein A9X06_06740 [Mycobacterium sp. 852002-51759_SCH5129042]PPI90755.1 hypothetical protein C5E46_30985 [Nocardia nova]